MAPHINLLPVDHSEMASYKRRFASVINAIFAKALINANGYLEFYFTHSINVSKLRARSGFSRLHRPIDEKTGLEYFNSYPVVPLA